MSFIDRINKLHAKNRDLHSIAKQLEQNNDELRNKLEAGTDEGAGSLTESDEEGPSRKRKRSEE